MTKIFKNMLINFEKPITCTTNFNTDNWPHTEKHRTPIWREQMLKMPTITDPGLPEPVKIYMIRNNMVLTSGILNPVLMLLIAK